MGINDPKYYPMKGRIYNQQSDEVIPDDEPCFIIRARDKKALVTLKAYFLFCAEEGGDPTHLKAISNRIEEFEKFEKENPERMKEPDTDLGSGNDG